MRNLLRTLDKHALSLQSAQLTRPRNYDDRFTLRVRHPRNAPAWTYVTQNTPADTEFSAPNTPIVPEGSDDETPDEE